MPWRPISPSKPRLHGVDIHGCPHRPAYRHALPGLGEPFGKVVLSLHQPYAGNLVTVASFSCCRHVNHQLLLLGVGCLSDDVEHLLLVGERYEWFVLVTYAPKVMLDKERCMKRVGKGVDLSCHDAPYSTARLFARDA